MQNNLKRIHEKLFKLSCPQGNVNSVASIALAQLFKLKGGLKMTISLPFKMYFVQTFQGITPSGFPDILHNRVNNDHKSAILNFIKVKFFRAYSPLKPHILFYGNGLATWYVFPDITHFEVDNGCMSAIFNSIELKFLRT